MVDKINTIKKFDIDGMLNFIDGWTYSQNPNRSYIITEYLTQ